jgi:cell wall-associated NlpC family hydrolase
MPFLRPGQVAAFASPTPKFRQLGLLTLFSLSAAVSASAKPVKSSKTTRQNRTTKPVGVKAWTSGSQTYIRARPGSNVPPVAKVARHTQLFVWGKYNGWYRVETHDHIFGWVFNEYLNSPGIEKVPTLAPSTAKIASNRTANQVMYGTPALLKKHYAKYRSVGALEGLKKQGIYLAVAPKPSAKPKTRIAGVKAVPKPAKSLAKPRIASTPRIRERVVIEPIAPRAYTPRRSAPVKTEVSPIPAVENHDDLTPVTAVEPVPSASRNDAEARGVDAERIAGAARGGTSSVRMFARAASAAASRPSGGSSTAAPAAEPVVVAPVNPVVTQAPVVRAAASKPVVVKKAVAKPRVAAKPKATKKRVTRTRSKSRYAATKERKRQQLRVQMGLSPRTSPPSVIAPVSPVELMRAREEYLNSRKARLGAPAPITSTSPASPSIGLAPLPAPTGPLGGPDTDSLAPTPPAEISPTSFEGYAEPLPALVTDETLHPLYPLLSNPQVVALAKLKPKVAVASKAAAKAGPLSARGGVVRGGSPRDRAALTRGGSPRDRMGAGMATQALSYRGMPYIRGAASPSRGFDCSGLIYFLLRQRGYNPPRTAAGYKNWGTAVPRGQWKAGDLVLFSNTYKRGISHIGVYLGENKFVHAATTRTGVRVSSLNEAYYAKKYSGARRIK